MRRIARVFAGSLAVVMAPVVMAGPAAAHTNHHTDDSFRSAIANGAPQHHGTLATWNWLSASQTAMSRLSSHSFDRNNNDWVSNRSGRPACYDKVSYDRTLMGRWSTSLRMIAVSPLALAVLVIVGVASGGDIAPQADLSRPDAVGKERLVSARDARSRRRPEDDWIP